MGGLRSWLLTGALVLMTAGAATGQVAEKSVTFPARSSPTDFVVDEAKLMGVETTSTVTAISRSLVAAHDIPIVVVTIQSLSRYGIASDDIAGYARSLFDDWGIGHADWNRGILLVVAVDDRKARIELGADWRFTKQEETRQVMHEQIIPAFKAGNYSVGILRGVRGLDAMARSWFTNQKPAPPPGDDDVQEAPFDWSILIWLVVGGALLAWTVVSIQRDGTNSIAWKFWAVVFKVAAIVVVAGLAAAASGGGSSSGSSSGSSWGGGGSSWGGGGSSGGSSGGGGSTGSW